MDVIGFVCVSQGSSTVQLHDSLGTRRACTRSDAGFRSQNGDHTWGLYYRRVAFCCALFRGQKDSMQNILIKKCFLFMVGRVCRVKRFTTGSRNVAVVSLMTKRLKRRCGSGWDNNQKTSVLRVSTHWQSDGTSASMSRNKCIFQV
jgi:hypothetical protein